jgi:hypothetical protein
VDNNTDIPQVGHLTSNVQFDNLLASEAEPIFSVGRWDVRPLVLTPGKAEALWEIVSKFKTLFSDFSPKNFDSWAVMLVDPDSIWIEVCEGRRLAGIGTFKGMSALTECECHFFALDRQPAEKADAWRKTLEWIFTQYPMLHRVTMNPPSIYYAAIRTALKIGFVHEGVKRETLMIRGRWTNQTIMSILRREAECHSEQ